MRRYPAFSSLTLLLAILVALAAGVAAGITIGKRLEVVCYDDAVFDPISDYRADVYAGKFAYCGDTPVLILD